MRKKNLLEQLEEYLDLKKESEQVYEMWERLEKEKLSFGSPSDGMPKAANKRTLIDIDAAADARAQDYYDLYTRALKELRTTEQIIDKLDKSLHRRIIRHKYIDGMEWYDICEVIHWGKTKYFEILNEAEGVLLSIE